MYKFGRDISISGPIKLDIHNADKISTFDCGNAEINKYVKYIAKKDTRAVSFFRKDIETNNVIQFYTVSCSGIMMKYDNKIVVIPAVEIEYFAIDDKYKHLKYSIDDDCSFSNTLLDGLIGDISYFTENYCGADKIVLYSVPKAVNFYKRSGFKIFDKDIMEPSKHPFLEGCIPMYFDLNYED